MPRTIARFLLLAFCAVSSGLLADPPRINWTGNFARCDSHAELLKRDSMRLGVRLSNSNPAVAKEFKRAMDFWAGIIDMAWHEDATSSCALELVDGTPAILQHAVVARAQFVEWQKFEGWIAFDPRAPLTRTEMYLTAVHEIGHMLGLRHNPNPESVMYYIDLEGPEVLDAYDLKSLAAHHTLRLDVSRAPIPVTSRSISR
jgi:hypothetical protein